jgi:hypothetical protein
LESLSISSTKGASRADILTTSHRHLLSLLKHRRVVGECWAAFALRQAQQFELAERHVVELRERQSFGVDADEAGAFPALSNWVITPEIAASIAAPTFVSRFGSLIAAIRFAVVIS